MRSVMRAENNGGLSSPAAIALMKLSPSIHHRFIGDSLPHDVLGATCVSGMGCNPD
jgi:hypothetical protein